MLQTPPILLQHIQMNAAPRAVGTADRIHPVVVIQGINTVNPEQLFELFYKSVREDMNPFGLRPHNGMYHWWHERFMNAFYGIQEPRHLRSWAETPQMWLAGYREKEKGHEE